MHVVGGPLVSNMWLQAQKCLLFSRFMSSCPSLLRQYDIVIGGGGIMGCSSAYFLASRLSPSAMCVVERDTKVKTIIMKFCTQFWHIKCYCTKIITINYDIDRIDSRCRSSSDIALYPGLPSLVPRPYSQFFNVAH